MKRAWDKAMQNGDQLSGAPYLLDKAAGEAYVKACEQPARRKPAKGIHDDLERARKAGFAAPIAAGEQTFAVAAQMLVDRFGTAFMRGANFDAAFIKPVLFGDTISPRARVVAASPKSVELEVWVENQRGERVMAGHAKVKN